jgi:hypothetical protein
MAVGCDLLGLDLGDQESVEKSGVPAVRAT